MALRLMGNIIRHGDLVSSDKGNQAFIRTMRCDFGACTLDGDVNIGQLLCIQGAQYLHISSFPVP